MYTQTQNISEVSISPDVLIRELSLPAIDANILAKAEAGLPKLTDSDRQFKMELLAKGSTDPVLKRRTWVTTDSGSVMSAFYKNKAVKHSELLKYIKDILKVQEQITMVKQWIWGSSTTTPHTDYNRNSMLMYVLDPGGKNVETHWFVEPGYPVVRTWKPELTDMRDVRHLKKIYSMVLKPHTWYYFNSAVIHSVTNMTSDRIAFAINSSNFKNINKYE